MTCSLLVALRRCGRSRRHGSDGGEKAQIERMVSKNIRDSASTQEQQQTQSKAAEQRNQPRNPILIVRKAHNRLRTLTVQKKRLKVKFNP
jgi:hypothetical protein